MVIKKNFSKKSLKCYHGIHFKSFSLKSQKQPFAMFFKTDVYKNFINFTGKPVLDSLILESFISEAKKAMKCPAVIYVRIK